jgi:hypothetical protein
LLTRLFPQTCSRILLSEEDIQTFLKRFQSLGLETLRRKDLNKQVSEKTKRCTRCPHCHAFNGLVKKTGPIKFFHERYKVAKNNEEALVFKNTFAVAYEALRVRCLLEGGGSCLFVCLLWLDVVIFLFVFLRVFFLP